MEGKPITYKNFTVYPEYCGISFTHLEEISTMSNNFIVASTWAYESDYNTVYLLKSGITLYRRYKYRLFKSEIRDGLKAGSVKPEAVSINGKIF